MRALHTLRAGLAIATLVTMGIGCGSTNETIELGDVPTVTPTPARTSTPVAGATATVAVPTATETPGAGNPTPTPTVGAVPGGVQSITRGVVPFLRLGLGLTTGVTGSGSPVAAGASARRAGDAAASAEAQEIDDCPDGGTREQDNTNPLLITITLDACRVSDEDLGSFEIEGTIDVDILGGSIDFSLSLEDLINGDVFDFEGTLQGTPSGGGFVLDGGPIVVTTDDGDFELTFDDLTIDADGNLVSGGVLAVDTDDIFDDIMSVDMTLQAGGNTADALVTFDDASTQMFLLDLETGELTPTS